jgi:hypothetical protein
VVFMDGRGGCLCRAKVGGRGKAETEGIPSHGLLFNREDGCSGFSWNLDTLLPDHTPSNTTVNTLCSHYREIKSRILW